MKLAAIDLGSNAIRLLIKEVESDSKKVIFRKLNIIRVPIRLGLDVFNGGIISVEKYSMLKDTLMAFSMLMKAYGVEHYATAASSAMRDATNGEIIRRKLKNETGIDLNIISGNEEADIIVQSQLAMLEKNPNSIFVDVGGGSTEINIIHNGLLKHRKSFNIGTLRLMNNQVNIEEWNELKKFLKKNKDSKCVLIGTGGNINKVFSLLKITEGAIISLKKLKQFNQSISKLSITQRMNKYEIREDRADVIVHALSIYLFVIEHIELDGIYVPKVGLADGIIAKLYSEIK